MSFLETLPPHGAARDAAILSAIAAGKLDPVCWVPVRCGPVELHLSADYLSIGGGRVPMSAPVAQAAVDALEAVLPTPRIVEAIEAAARERGRLVPFVAWPRWQDDSQLYTSTILWREANIGDVPAGTLVAGPLKDVVIAPRLATMPGKLLIFGGLDVTGKRVQNLQTNTAHGAWFDGGYAHGVRAIRDACTVYGKAARVSELYQDDTLSTWLSAEGPLPVVRYPTASAPQPTGPRTLRRGMSGDDVRELQRLLAARGYVLVRDGIFGSATEAAVREYQGERGLDVDGIAGPATLASLRGVDAEDTDPGTLPSILSDAEVDALFGPLAWVPAPTAAEPGAVRITNTWTKDNLRRVVIPQLRGVVGAPADGGVYLHRLIAEQTRALFAAWEASGLLPLVRTWAGSWNPRLVRGGTTLSRHSYATSFDINAQWNPLGKPAAPRGAIGSVVDLVPLAIAHGYTNGMNWSRPDAMHMEAVKAL